jgi:hypothetical protein
MGIKKDNNRILMYILMLKITARFAYITDVLCSLGGMNYSSRSCVSLGTKELWGKEDCMLCESNKNTEYINLRGAKLSVYLRSTGHRSLPFLPVHDHCLSLPGSRRTYCKRSPYCHLFHQRLLSPHLDL